MTMTDVEIPFGENASEKATLLLAAAEDAGLDFRAVRTNGGAFLVPEEIAEAVNGSVTEPEPTPEPAPEPEPEPESDGTTTEPDPVPASEVEEPKGNASTEEWVKYAESKGATEEDLKDLRRNDIAAKYGTKDKE